MKVVKNRVQIVIADPDYEVKKISFIDPVEGSIIKGKSGSGMVKIYTEKQEMELHFESFQDGSVFLNRLLFSSVDNSFRFIYDGKRYCSADYRTNNTKQENII